MKENILNMLEYLNNGIEVNGVIREFDIVDFYQYFNTGTKEFINYLDNMFNTKTIEVQDYVKLKTFLRKNESKEIMSAQDVKMLFQEKHEFNTKFDERGRSIKDSGRVITLEEKKYIFDYIINNNLPLHRKVYSILINRLVNGELTLDKQRKV